MDGRRAWTSLAGLTINSVAYVPSGFVQLRFTDGSSVDVGVDDAFDQDGMRLVVTDDMEDAT